MRWSRDLGWDRFVCCSDCVRSFLLVRNEKLQVLRGSECSKGERQGPRCVILVRESENGKDVRSPGGSVRERHESRCVLPLLRRRHPSACVPRGMWNEIGAGMDRGHDDHDCKFRELAMHDEACKTVSVSLVGKVQAWSLVVGGSPGIRAVVYPIPRVGLLEERFADDTAEGMVVKTVTDRIFTRMRLAQDV